MKKNVLREYLKNRKKDVTVFEKDKFFTFTVDDVDGYKEGAIEKVVKELAKPKRTRKPKGEK